MNNQFSLTHPGFAYITNEHGIEKDFLKPTVSSGLVYGEGTIPASFNAQNWPEPFGTVHKNRWADPTYNLLEFDGYGMYTIWALELQKVGVISDLTDIRIRFNYQYEHVLQKKYAESFWVNLCTKDGQQLKLNFTPNGELGDIDNIDKMIQKLVADHSGIYEPCSND